MAARDDEQRTIDVDVQDIDTRGRTLHGYAAVYGAVSDDLGGFTEVVRAGAFANVLDADVRALLNHDPSQVLGRTRSGTLRLQDEQRGLRFEIDLPDSPLGENVRASVARGDIDGASFRFKVERDSWDGDVRTIESVKELKDVTVATFGAYPAASVELRTKPDPGDAQEAVMGNEPENQTTTTDESRGLEVRDTNSLRVEERAEPNMFLTLSDLYADRGFFENRYAVVSWDEYEQRSVTYTPGTALTDLTPIRQASAPFGYDRRWIYPAFPTTPVDGATTSVQYIKQSARSLAGTAVVRALDAVTTKPETSSTVDYATLQLSQVATVTTNVPRIYTAQPLFQSIMQSDLTLSINDGLDTVCTRGIATAGTLTAKSGTLLVDVRKCITGLQTAGYAPDTLLIDPAGAETLDLLQSFGSEKFWTFGAGRFAPGDLFGLAVRVGKNAGTAVVDSTAFGRMYASPVELRAFEQDAGATNRQTLRMELNAGFAVERITAATRIV